MGIPTIKLDERTFQDFVDEAKLRIPRYCPEWTNHNVSDPGVTLIELFAYMIDQLLYQVNRVPEKNYRAFLDMIGVKLAPPNASHCDVTFRLSAAQPNPLVIPRGTEVATVRTESQTAQTFTTEDDLVVVPPKLKYVLTTSNLQSFLNRSDIALSKSSTPIEVFQEEPQPGNAFYLGYDQNVARNTLVIELDGTKLGVGINPNDPPLAWEYWDGAENTWLGLQVIRDTTGGLTYASSEIEFHIPSSAGQREIELLSGEEPLMAWWIRCRYKALAQNQPGYNKAPLIGRFHSYTIGGTISTVHSRVIYNEELGRSKGEPGQTFRLENRPVLTLNPANNETIIIDDGAGTTPEFWHYVEDFSASGPTDKHFICDYVTGELGFGPAIRNPRGEEEQHGAIPPFGKRIMMLAYRTGGGIEGNVGSNTINVLKTSVPYIDTVTNLRVASGGTNAESLEHALIRGPSTIRARNRAVTAEDFEVLTREATSGVARVHCMTPSAIDRPMYDNAERVEPGTVVLLIVPEVEAGLRELRPEHLDISGGMYTSINSYLDERRLLTTRIEVTKPKYQWVTVQARIRTSNSFIHERVRREAERRIYQFIRPLQGGPDPALRFEQSGEGWPFGRTLHVSEIFPILYTIEGVEFVEKVELFPVVDLARGQAGIATDLIQPGPRGLLCSYRHQIIIM